MRRRPRSRLRPQPAVPAPRRPPRAPAGRSLEHAAASPAPRKGLRCQHITSGLRIILNHGCRRAGGTPPGAVNNDDLRRVQAELCAHACACEGSSRDRGHLDVSSESPCKENPFPGAWLCGCHVGGPAPLREKQCPAPQRLGGRLAPPAFSMLTTRSFRRRLQPRGAPRPSLGRSRVIHVRLSFLTAPALRYPQFDKPGPLDQRSPTSSAPGTGAPLRI